jgi:hypothetical protein
LDVSASLDEDNEETVLHFPPSSSLRNVQLKGCKNLVLDMEEGHGFCGLSSLESVTIIRCDKIFSGWTMEGGEAQTERIIKPLPTFLKSLKLCGEQNKVTMHLFSNLTSLTNLELVSCKDIIVDGFDPRITFNLKSLTVFNYRNGETGPYSVAADLLAALVRTKTMPVGSFQLVSLNMDSIVAPICSRLSATLQRLFLSYDWQIENFTKERDGALQLLTLLQILEFYHCRALRSLPQVLHRLSSLQEITIQGLNNIQSLPKEGLPDSL